MFSCCREADAYPKNREYNPYSGPIANLAYMWMQKREQEKQNTEPDRADNKFNTDRNNFNCNSNADIARPIRCRTPSPHSSRSSSRSPSPRSINHREDHHYNSDRRDRQENKYSPRDPRDEERDDRREGRNEYNTQRRDGTDERDNRDYQRADKDDRERMYERDDWDRRDERRAWDERLDKRREELRVRALRDEVSDKENRPNNCQLGRESPRTVKFETQNELPRHSSQDRDNKRREREGEEREREYRERQEYKEREEREHEERGREERIRTRERDIREREEREREEADRENRARDQREKIAHEREWFRRQNRDGSLNVWGWDSGGHIEPNAVQAAWIADANSRSKPSRSEVEKEKDRTFWRDYEQKFDKPAGAASIPFPSRPPGTTGFFFSFFLFVPLSNRFCASTHIVLF